MSWLFLLVEQSPYTPHLLEEQFSDGSRVHRRGGGFGLRMRSSGLE